MKQQHPLTIIKQVAGDLKAQVFGIVPAAVAMKQKLLLASAKIKEVKTQEQAVAAAKTELAIARELKELEASRKEVKAPVIELADKIDSIAKAHRLELEQEKTRLHNLVTEHEHQRFLKAKAEREAREAEIERLAEEARRKMEKAKKPETKAAIRDAAAAAISKTVDEHEEPVATQGVSAREEWAFEVTNIDELYLSMPQLCNKPTPRTLEINALLKSGVRELPGLRIYEKFKTTIRQTYDRI